MYAHLTKGIALNLYGVAIHDILKIRSPRLITIIGLSKQRIEINGNSHFPLSQ